MDDFHDTMGGVARSSAAVAARTQAADRRARDALADIATLGTAVNEIDCIVHTIADIAEQTSLLALNATIEASRAGGAGRGVGAVAIEVKELSRQTADATERMAEAVGAILSLYTAAASGMEAVRTDVLALAERQESVSRTVSEQSAASGQIAVTMSSVTRGRSGITSRLAEPAALSR